MMAEKAQRGRGNWCFTPYKQLRVRHDKETGPVNLGQLKEVEK